LADGFDTALVFCQVQYHGDNPTAQWDTLNLDSQSAHAEVIQEAASSGSKGHVHGWVDNLASVVSAVIDHGDRTGL